MAKFSLLVVVSQTSPTWLRSVLSAVLCLYVCCFAHAHLDRHSRVSFARSPSSETKSLLTVSHTHLETRILTSKQTEVKIFVRRGGPNYQEGLERMRDLSSKLDIPIEVFGPETHMTYVCSLALGKPTKAFEPKYVPQANARVGLTLSSGRLSGGNTGQTGAGKSEVKRNASDATTATSATTESKLARADSEIGLMSPRTPHTQPTVPSELTPTGLVKGLAAGDFQLFHTGTKSIVYGMQPGAVQVLCSSCACVFTFFLFRTCWTSISFAVVPNLQ